MEFEWKQETDRFLRIWQTRRCNRVQHTAEAWNERADMWDKELREDEVRKARSERRVNSTASFLREHGLLTGGTDVIDIGCGPGRFVTEFAKTARHVTGVDISPHMAAYGTKHAAEAGIQNVTFLAADFKEADIDLLGWRKGFDLVFASITPAISNGENLQKAEDMSRGYCFYGAFVHAHDTVAEEAIHSILPDVSHASAWDGRAFYALFNLLWLRGRFPEITYFTERGIDRVPVDMGLAERITEKLPLDIATPTVIQQVYRYLAEHADQDGLLDYPSERTYGWMLWDVRKAAIRNYRIHE